MRIVQTLAFWWTGNTGGEKERDWFGQGSRNISLTAGLKKKENCSSEAQWCSKGDNDLWNFQRPQSRIRWNLRHEGIRILWEFGGITDL